MGGPAGPLFFQSAPVPPTTNTTMHAYGTQILDRDAISQAIFLEDGERGRSIEGSQALTVLMVLIL